MRVTQVQWFMYQNWSEPYLTVFCINCTANICYDFIQIQTEKADGFWNSLHYFLLLNMWIWSIACALTEFFSSNWSLSKILSTQDFKILMWMLRKHTNLRILVAPLFHKQETGQTFFESTVFCRNSNRSYALSSL